MEAFQHSLCVFMLLCCSPLVVAHNTNVWMDILTCVRDLTTNTTMTSHRALDQHDVTNQVRQANTTDDPTRQGHQQEEQNFSMVRLFSIICGNKDRFVECMDSSLQNTNDSMARLIGAQFNADLVVRAYDGLCANISAIEESGADALTCLTQATLTTCQNEMADYFFYMGVIKKFAPPAEQLSPPTLQTLLCSVTSQRRDCELRSVRMCSPKLADVMEEFYRQTRSASCHQENSRRRDLSEQAEPRARP